METADSMERLQFPQSLDSTLTQRDLLHSLSPGAGGLALRLNQELHHLERCANLVRVQFAHTRQRMGKEDLQWMLTHLTSLWPWGKCVLCWMFGKS